MKYLENKTGAAKVTETVAFATTRALFIGSLGAIAALAGATVFVAQRWFWVLLGALYIVLGVLYLARKQWALMRMFGPKLSRARDTRGAVALGVLFGLNIPACAAPILGALVAASVGAGSVARGFLAMAVFGIALSLPLVLVVFSQRARSWLDRAAAAAERLPFWTGAVFIVLGVWSVYFGVTASLPNNETAL